MNKVSIFFKQYYEIHKQEYWFIIFLNLALGISLFLISPKGLIQAAVIGFMFLKSLSFARSSSIMPSATSDVDRFSWKYFQGLPLSKREVLWSLSLTDLFLVSPLIIWLASFHRPVLGLFLDDKFESPVMVIKIILFAIPAAFILGFKSFSTLILFPRKQYSKNDPRIEFYHSIKMLAIYGSVLLYAGVGLTTLNEVWNLEVGKYVGNIFSAIVNNFFSYWSVGVLFFLVVYHFRRTLRIWQNEKIGYLKIKWDHKKDFSIIACCAVASFYILNGIESPAPRYFGDPLHKAIYRKDLTKVNELIKSGQNIHLVNKYGFSAIHVAAFTGNEVAYKLLESLGANSKISVESTDSKFQTKYNSHSPLMLSMYGKNPELVKHIIKGGADLNKATRINGQTPLHLAAMNCRFETIDVLLAAGANLNALNKHGETALHRAAYSGCFSVVTSLIDAGIDPSVKNAKGKIALELLPKDKKKLELAYYLEKKTRTPAGKVTP